MGYYALDTETFELIKFHLDAIESEHIDRMRDNERGFVIQMQAALERYDRNLSCSLKQKDWLRQIYSKYVENEEEEIESTDKRFERWSRR